MSNKKITTVYLEMGEYEKAKAISVDLNVSVNSYIRKAIAEENRRNEKRSED